MKTYTYKKTDKGIIGDSFEKTIKDILGLKNADYVSSQGRCDFRHDHINYEVKQNGGVIRYNPTERYIKGSSRVIYATHVAHELIDNQDDTVSVTIDLKNTEFFVIGRKEFVDYLLKNGYAKQNKSRGQVNIQTLYNYTKDAYHGKKGKALEEWLYDNCLDDEIIDLLLD